MSNTTTASTLNDAQKAATKKKLNSLQTWIGIFTGILMGGVILLVTNGSFMRDTAIILIGTTGTLEPERAVQGIIYVAVPILVFTIGGVGVMYNTLRFLRLLHS